MMVGRARMYSTNMGIEGRPGFKDVMVSANSQYNIGGNQPGGIVSAPAAFCWCYCAPRPHSAAAQQPHATKLQQ